MRILYIAGEVVPGANGGSVHVWEVADNLTKLGHDVTILVNRGENQTSAEEIGRVKVIRCSMSVGGKVIPLLGAKKLRMILSRRYDLILDRYVTFGGLGTIVAKLTGAPLVLEVNSPHTEELLWRFNIDSDLLKSGLRQWTRTQFKSASGVISPLESIVPKCARCKTKLVSWGANVERFNPDIRNSPRCRELRERYSLADKCVVLFMGTFREWHGALQIPDLVERVVTTESSPVGRLSAAGQRHVRFLMVGDGDCLPKIKYEVAKRRLSGSVIFTGAMPHEEMPFYTAVSHIGIAPYDVDSYEPLKRFGFYWSPLKIFEYMAAGLPVITVACHPLDDIVQDGVRGRVTRPKDTAAMAEAIVALAGDERSRREMGEKARAHVAESFSWRRHVEDLDDFFCSLIAKGPRNSEGRCDSSWPGPS